MRSDAAPDHKSSGFVCPASCGALWEQLATSFRRDAWIIAFMAIGLLFSFAYVYSAAFSFFSLSHLPRPLFTSLAVILSVLLLTPAHRWWLYLAVYYVLQVSLAAWFTAISLPLLVASNIANLFEPLIDAALFRRFVPPDRNFIPDTVA